MTRLPQVAGQFYPENPANLKKELTKLVSEKEKKEAAIGLVSPHAGYLYSGEVAGLCFSKIKIPETCVILGPNHTGQGVPFSIMSSGVWQMPLGDVEIDTTLASEILKNSKYLEEDVQAHTHEHSIEVQLPFLQHFALKPKIVPIILADADYTTYHKIGKALAIAIKTRSKECLIIASSDMTHYKPHEQATSQDKLAIEAIIDLDGEELLRRIKKFNITMCGYGPVVCMLSAAKELGATRGELVKYETSGKASGDYNSVVGYAGVIIK